MDELAICVPSLDAWDQFIWPPAAAVPRALTEAEPYGYCCGQAIVLGPVMPAAQLRVTDKVGTYLCAAWALVFEGSVLAYNPTRDEAEWVPVCGLTNDLTWAKERSAVALANYMPCVSQEAAQITRLGACRLVSWPADSSMSEEEEEEQEETDPEPPVTDAELEQGEEDEEKIRQVDQEDEQEPDKWWCSRDWEAVMGEEERLAYEDLWSDSDATADGCSLRRLTPLELGSPMEVVVEVHMRESEVEDL